MVLEKPDRRDWRRFLRQRSWAAALLLPWAAVILSCVPQSPSIVHFPAGSCVAGTQIQYESFASDAACVSACPVTQGIRDPVCVAGCWVPNLGGILPFNACLRVSSVADLQGLHVRCVGSSGAGAWLDALFLTTGSLASCSVILD